MAFYERNIQLVGIDLQPKYLTWNFYKNMQL